MSGEELQLLVQRAARLSRLGRNEIGAEHDVSEDALLGRLINARCAELVNREGQDVGGTRLVHPVLMQGRHALEVDERDAQFALRMQAQCAEEVHREPLERGRIARPARLVADGDIHGGQGRRCHSARLAS